ncbi:hypothetical protein AAMO2058_001469600 [Amorphochlora amoebiformis]
MDSLENGKQKAGKEAFFSRERTSFPQNFRTHGVRSRGSRKCKKNHKISSRENDLEGREDLSVARQKKKNGANRHEKKDKWERQRKRMKLNILAHERECKKYVGKAVEEVFPGYGPRLWKGKIESFQNGTFCISWEDGTESYTESLERIKSLLSKEDSEEDTQESEESCKEKKFDSTISEEQSISNRNQRSNRTLESVGWKNDTMVRIWKNGMNWDIVCLSRECTRGFKRKRVSSTSDIHKAVKLALEHRQVHRKEPTSSDESGDSSSEWIPRFPRGTYLQVKWIIIRQCPGTPILRKEVLG